MSSRVTNVTTRTPSPAVTATDPEFFASTLRPSTNSGVSVVELIDQDHPHEGFSIQHLRIQFQIELRVPHPSPWYYSIALAVVKGGETSMNAVSFSFAEKGGGD